MEVRRSKRLLLEGLESGLAQRSLFVSEILLNHPHMITVSSGCEVG